MMFVVSDHGSLNGINLALIFNRLLQSEAGQHERQY